LKQSIPTKYFNIGKRCHWRTMPYPDNLIGFAFAAEGGTVSFPGIGIPNLR
jgi:hypothetical protein